VISLPLRRDHWSGAEQMALQQLQKLLAQKWWDVLKKGMQLGEPAEHKQLASRDANSVKPSRRMVSGVELQQLEGG
jgi:hypothetical protein